MQRGLRLDRYWGLPASTSTGLWDPRGRFAIIEPWPKRSPGGPTRLPLPPWHVSLSPVFSVRRPPSSMVGRGGPLVLAALVPPGLWHTRDTRRPRAGGANRSDRARFSLRALSRARSPFLFTALHHPRRTVAASRAETRISHGGARDRGVRRSLSCEADRSRRRCLKVTSRTFDSGDRRSLRVEGTIPTVLIAARVDRIVAGRAQLVCDAWSA